MDVAIIGGGPAGLRAAEVAAGGGACVTLYEAMPSVGRKFLVAGRGGLNLSHAETPVQFAARYTGPDQPPDFWRRLLEVHDSASLQAWAAGLGIETFTASTGRIYPLGLKAAPLLRRWVERLRGLGVRLATRHRFLGLAETPWPAARFSTPAGEQIIRADAVVLALGGGSWPQTGSDGAWLPSLAASGVEVSPLQPANCGWECPWTPTLLASAEGLPLKSIAVEAAGRSVRGELLITRYGLEGGALYQLGSLLRSLPQPVITIDFKPEVTAERLLAKLGPIQRNLLPEAVARWRLSPAAAALLAERTPFTDPAALVQQVKHYPLALRGPRPLAEAISSAGGVRWRGLDEHLMLRVRPGVFVAGEMIDWEAPTGGYLLHGCWALGTLAAQAALRWCGQPLTARDSNPS